MKEKSGVLNDLFVSREENICVITENDKEKIKLLTIGFYENEKFYKIGFADAINLVFECIKRGI